MNRLHPVTRLVLAVAVLALTVAYFVPLWQIQLWAPQYPEGLNMKIWINNLSGSFDIINGLNHYIGMAMIKVDMFPEFGYMIYVLGALIGIGLLAAIIGTRRWLWIYVSILALGALAGLGDFYAWGYQYGHNLNPNAAIQVPGMSYQPPIIGYKNLLNFTAYSGPDIGGWVMIVSGCLAGALLGWEQFLRKDPNAMQTASVLAKRAAPALSVLVVFCLTNCSPKTEAMRLGKDECTGCKMIVSDQRFGAEIVTKKGRVLKFDDLGCMNQFIESGSIAQSEIAMRVVIDFNRPNTFIRVEDAYFLKNDELKSPMRSDLAAFATDAEMKAVKAKLGTDLQGKRPAVVGN